MDCRWLAPDDPAPAFNISDFSQFEQWRRAAARAAAQMAAESGYDAEEDESEDEEPRVIGMRWDGEFVFASSVHSSRYTLLRDALARFNSECEEEGARFQWFDDTIQGPLVLQEVRGNHRSGCELCSAIPGSGELYFKYDLGYNGARWSYRKLCMTCGMGIVFAAEVELDAGRGVNADEAYGDSEDDLELQSDFEDEEEEEDSQELEQQQIVMPPPAAAAAAADNRYGVRAEDVAEQLQQQHDVAAEPPALKRQRR